MKIFLMLCEKKMMFQKDYFLKVFWSADLVLFVGLHKYDFITKMCQETKDIIHVQYNMYFLAANATCFTLYSYYLIIMFTIKVLKAL